MLERYFGAMNGSGYELGVTQVNTKIVARDWKHHDKDNSIHSCVLQMRAIQGHVVYILPDGIERIYTGLLSVIFGV